MVQAITRWIGGAIAGAVVLAVELTGASACLHAPPNYAGSIEETSQEALVFFADGRQELVLKVGYTIKDHKVAPPSLAWVIPVPSVPDHYKVHDPRVFGELYQFTAPRPRGKQMKSKSLVPQPVAASIELLEQKTAGEYTIQPIKGSGEGAGAALNAWLVENGFGPVGADALAYYLERGWTFLAIRIDPAKSKKNLAARGAFRPLRISFATEKIVYPLKFSSHQGVFPVTLYVVSERGLVSETAPEGAAESLRARLAEFGFNSRLSGRPVRQLPGDNQPLPLLAALWGEIVAEGRLTFSTGVLDKLSACCINQTDAPLSAWSEDFSLQPVQ